MRTKNDILNNFQFFFDDYFSTKSYDISETEDTISLSIVAPGEKKEHFKIELLENKLKVNCPGQTEKMFKLPPTVNLDTLKATYEAGILKIFMKKDKSKTRKIEIT